MSDSTKIVGDIAGVPNPKSDWLQNNERKANYIKNKPNLDLYGNALKGNKKGEIVAITDISPIVHNVAVKAASKNLYDNSKTLRKMDDGSAATRVQSGYFIPVKQNTNYILSATNVTTQPMYSIKGITKEDYIENPTWSQVWSTGVQLVGNKNTPFNSGEYEYIAFRTWNENSAYGITEDTVFQLEEGTTATAYTPYVPDVSAATVKVCGKNTCDYTKFVGITPDDKAKVVLDGDTFIFPAGNKYYGLVMTNGLSLIKGQKYTFSYKAVTSYAYPECQINYTDGTKTIANNGKTVTIENKDIKLINFYIANGQLAETDFKLSKFQVEAGTAVTEYEYPKEPTSYPIAPDGTVEGVTSIYPSMTITTNTTGVVVDTEYNRDINKAFAELQQALISLGGNI